MFDSAAPSRIISASRRTDLPGSYPEECAARLRLLRRPVHSVFFWTRFPASLLRPGALAELLQGGIENPFVHLTVTGLGGGPLEPRAPTSREVLDQLDPLLAALRGQPERLFWRFDPVIRETLRLEVFAQLAREFGGRGVQTCIFSFPAQLSLKGPLDEQYRRCGITRPARAERRELALRLAEIAARSGIRLHACAQPQLVEDTAGVIQPACCISAELAQRLHPRGVPLALEKDPAQRRACTCVESHDIGRYSDRCRSGCAYCYSAAGGLGGGPQEIKASAP